jgi:hypothetical protein
MVESPGSKVEVLWFRIQGLGSLAKRFRFRV